jgi:hypothetical protein
VVDDALSRGDGEMKGNLPNASSRRSGPKEIERQTSDGIRSACTYFEYTPGCETSTSPGWRREILRWRTTSKEPLSTKLTAYPAEGSGYPSACSWSEGWSKRETAMLGVLRSVWSRFIVQSGPKYQNSKKVQASEFGSDYVRVFVP